MAKKESAEKAVRDIRRKTRRRFSAEEKIRIVIEGLRGEESIASLCRREGIVANLYYRWSKRIVRVKLDEDGNRMRKSNTLASYGIEATQLFFPDDFAYETKILEQIGKRAGCADEGHCGLRSCGSCGSGREDGCC